MQHKLCAALEGLHLALAHQGRAADGKICRKFCAVKAQAERVFNLVCIGQRCAAELQKFVAPAAHGLRAGKAGGAALYLLHVVGQHPIPAGELVGPGGLSVAHGFSACRHLCNGAAARRFTDVAVAGGVVQKAGNQAGGLHKGALGHAGRAVVRRLAAGAAALPCFGRRACDVPGERGGAVGKNQLVFALIQRHQHAKQPFCAIAGHFFPI